MRENLSSRFVNNKGADQPAHSCRLISAFIIHFLKSFIPELVTGEISVFYLFTLAEETGSSLTLSETPRTGFVASRPILCTSSHRVVGNQKRFQQWKNADQKLIETVFSIAICRHTGDKLQSKTLFLTIFDLRSSIVLAFSIATYPV